MENSLLGQMLDSGRQLADRGRALADRARDTAPLPGVRERSAEARPRRGLSERLSDRVRMHRPQVPFDEQVRARIHWWRDSAQEMGSTVRNPRWLLRLGCAVLAIVLVLVLIHASHSPRGGGSGKFASSHGGSAVPGSSASTSGVPSLAQISRTGGNLTTGTHGKQGASTGSTAHRASAAHGSTAAGAGYIAKRTSSSGHSGTRRTHTAAHHTTSHSTTSSSSSSSTTTGTSSTTSQSGPTTTVVSNSSSGPSSSSSPTGVMSGGSFEDLRLGEARLSRLTDRFGPTATPVQLGSVFGSNWASILAPHQPVGDTCVYYLTSPSHATSVYQLCFNGGGRLAEKTVIGR